MITEETVQLALLECLLEKLPDELASASAEPMRYLVRGDEGKMCFVEELVKLPTLAEIWAEQHITLAYPALILHYRETTATTIAECDEQDFALLFQADLIITHHEPEQVQAVWLRYADCVKKAVRSINLPVTIETPGQRITESGSLDESQYLRRGLVDLQITF